jgi:hypothetical protein
VVTLWVVNASPIILLAKVGLVDLLRQIGTTVVIPEAAVLEIQRRGMADPAVQALAQAKWLASVDPGPIPATVAAFGLGNGNIPLTYHNEHAIIEVLGPSQTRSNQLLCKP